MRISDWSSDVCSSDLCIDARVNANGTNPQLVTGADGDVTLQPATVQTMCELKSARFNNVVVNQNSSSEEVTQRNKMVAGGLIFEQDRGVFKVDVAYQTSRSVTENFNAEEIGRASCRERVCQYV